MENIYLRKLIWYSWPWKCHNRLQYKGLDINISFLQWSIYASNIFRLREMRVRYFIPKRNHVSHVQQSFNYVFARFKVSLPFEPYLYLLVAKENIQEVTAFLSKKFGQYIVKITQVRTKSCSVIKILKIFIFLRDNNMLFDGQDISYKQQQLFIGKC